MKAKGFTVIELLIATTVGVAIIGISISLVLSNRRVYDLDRARTELNQNLRASLDLIGTDVRIAGQRLPADFPALSISGNGTVLTVRTSRISTVLPVCAPLSEGSNTIVVAEESSITPGCSRIAVSPSDARHAPLVDFQAERTRGGATVTAAYIFDPATRCNDATRLRGEFFTYAGENNPTSGPVSLSRAGSNLSRSYPVGSRIYLLEQRQYSLNNGLLELSVNGSAPQAVANNISTVRFEAFVGNATSPVAGFCDASGNTLLWKTLGRVLVRLEGRIQARGSDIRRVLEADFLPRNVLSR